jgi:hypothetical protein
VAPVKKSVKAKTTKYGYLSKRFFIAVLHGGDWTKDEKTLADGPFYFGQAMKKVTGQDISDLIAVKDAGDLWVEFWRLSSSDTKIDSSNPYGAVERYLTDAWVASSGKRLQFDSGGVCMWLDRKEEGHMTIDKDGSSVVFTEATKELIRSEIEKLKVCMLHCIMFVDV